MDDRLTWGDLTPNERKTLEVFEQLDRAVLPVIPHWKRRAFKTGEWTLADDAILLRMAKAAFEMLLAGHAIAHVQERLRRNILPNSWK
jgi:hypothetical protein